MAGTRTASIDSYVHGEADNDLGHGGYVHYKGRLYRDRVSLGKVQSIDITRDEEAKTVTDIRVKIALTRAGEKEWPTSP